MSGAHRRAATAIPAGREPDRRRRPLLAGACATGLLALGVTVVPQAGASDTVPGATPAAATGRAVVAVPAAKTTKKPTTSKKPCTGCMTKRSEGFEEGGLRQWKGVGGAVLTVSEAMAASGRKSMMIDRAVIGAGAGRSISTGAPTSNVAMSVRLEPVPIAGTGTMPDVRAWVRLTVRGDRPDPVVVTQPVGEGDWTRISTWVSGRTLSIEITVAQVCGSAVGRRLYVDDVTVATLGRAAALATTDTVAATPTSTSPTSTSPTSTSPTTTPPVCDSPSPSTTTTTPPPSSVGMGFEDGTPGGWTAIGGSTVSVVAAAARSGSGGMRVTGVQPTSDRGVQLTLPGPGVAGTGRQYRVSLWVRISPKPAVTAAAAKATSGKPGKRVVLDISGVGTVFTSPVAVRTGGWTKLEAWFAPPEGVTSMTLTLHQEPQKKCGPTLKPIGSLDVDDVTLERVSHLPSATTGSGDDATHATAVVPHAGCTVTTK